MKTKFMIWLERLRSSQTLISARLRGCQRAARGTGLYPAWRYHPAGWRCARGCGGRPGAWGGNPSMRAPGFKLPV